MEPEESEDNESQYSIFDILNDVLKHKSKLGLVKLDLSGTIKGSNAAGEQRKLVSTAQALPLDNKENSATIEKIVFPNSYAQSDNSENPSACQQSAISKATNLRSTPLFQRSSSSDSKLHSAVKSNYQPLQKYNSTGLTDYKSDVKLPDSGITPVDINKLSYSSSQKKSNQQYFLESREFLAKLRGTAKECKAIPEKDNIGKGTSAVSDRLEPITECDSNLNQQQNKNPLDLLKLSSYPSLYDTDTYKKYIRSTKTDTASEIKKEQSIPMKRNYNIVDEVCAPKVDPPKKIVLASCNIKPPISNVDELCSKSRLTSLPPPVAPYSISQLSTPSGNVSPVAPYSISQRAIPSGNVSPVSSARVQDVDIKFNCTKPCKKVSPSLPSPEDISPLNYLKSSIPVAAESAPCGQSFVPAISQSLITNLPVQPLVSMAPLAQSSIPHPPVSVASKPLTSTMLPATIPSSTLPTVPKISTAASSTSGSVAFDTISVNDRRYIKQRKIGKGGSSIVFSVVDIQDFQNKALKLVNLDGLDESTLKSHLDEIKMLQRLQKSSRVVKLYDFERTPHQLKIVMEIGSLDLAEIVKNAFQNSSTLNAFTIQHYWNEMLISVQDIHKEGIIHSDLKPANFLLVAGTLKLIDFGISSSIQIDMTSIFKENQAGTLNYMSPESLLDVNAATSQETKIKIGIKSDIWSLGCILYVLTYGKTPFQHVTNIYQKLKVISDPNTRIAFPPTVKDNNLLDVLKKCLQYNPKNRPSIQELLEHPYLKG